MSIQATQDAASRASTQVSLGEFLSGDGEGSVEPTVTNDVSCNIAQRGDTRGDLDYSQTVYTTEHGSHYHAVQYGGICACPNLEGTKVSLAEAVKDGNPPCGVCSPVDYRRERPDEQPATVEGSG